MFAAKIELKDIESYLKPIYKEIDELNRKIKELLLESIKRAAIMGIEVDRDILGGYQKALASKGIEVNLKSVFKDIPDMAVKKVYSEEYE